MRNLFDPYDEPDDLTTTADDGGSAGRDFLRRVERELVRIDDDSVVAVGLPVDLLRDIEGQAQANGRELTGADECSAMMPMVLERSR